MTKTLKTIALAVAVVAITASTASFASIPASMNGKHTATPAIPASQRIKAETATHKAKAKQAHKAVAHKAPAEAPFTAKVDNGFKPKITTNINQGTAKVSSIAPKARR